MEDEQRTDSRYVSSTYLNTFKKLQADPPSLVCVLKPQVRPYIAIKCPSSSKAHAITWPFSTDQCDYFFQEFANNELTCVVPAAHLELEKSSLLRGIDRTAKAFFSIDSCDMELSHLVIDRTGGNVSRLVPEQRQERDIGYAIVMLPATHTGGVLVRSKATKARHLGAGCQDCGIDRVVYDGNRLFFTPLNSGCLVSLVFRMVNRVNDAYPEMVNELVKCANMPNQTFSKFVWQWFETYTNLDFNQLGVRDRIVVDLLAATGNFDIAFVQANHQPAYSYLATAANEWIVQEAVFYNAHQVPWNVQQALRNKALYVFLNQVPSATGPRTFLVFWAKQHRYRILGFRPSLALLRERLETGSNDICELFQQVLEIAMDRINPVEHRLLDFPDVVQLGDLLLKHNQCSLVEKLVGSLTLVSVEKRCYRAILNWMHRAIKEYGLILFEKSLLRFLVHISTSWEGLDSSLQFLADIAECSSYLSLVIGRKCEFIKLAYQNILYGVDMLAYSSFPPTRVEMAQNTVTNLLLLERHSFQSTEEGKSIAPGYLQRIPIHLMLYIDSFLQPNLLSFIQSVCNVVHPVNVLAPALQQVQMYPYMTTKALPLCGYQKLVENAYIEARIKSVTCHGLYGLLSLATDLQDLQEILDIAMVKCGIDCVQAIALFLQDKATNINIPDTLKKNMCILSFRAIFSVVHSRLLLSYQQTILAAAFDVIWHLELPGMIPSWLDAVKDFVTGIDSVRLIVAPLFDKIALVVPRQSHVLKRLAAMSLIHLERNFGSTGIVLTDCTCILRGFPMWCSCEQCTQVRAFFERSDIGIYQWKMKEACLHFSGHFIAHYDTLRSQNHLIISFDGEMTCMEKHNYRLIQARQNDVKLFKRMRLARFQI